MPPQFAYQDPGFLKLPQCCIWRTKCFSLLYLKGYSMESSAGATSNSLANSSMS